MSLSRLLLLCLIGTCHGFLGTIPLAVKRLAGFSNMRDLTSLDLVPIRNFRSDITFLDQSNSCFDNDGRLIGNGEGYELCVVQEEDLPDVARFVISSFGAEAISLSSDLNSFERALMHPTVGLLNAYSGLVAYAEVLSGLQSRTKDRLTNTDISAPELSGTREEKLKQAARSSLVLAVGRASKGSDWRIDVIASVELRLEPCDAKIPFSLPWLDRIERRLAQVIGMKDGARDLKPYFSNLCVDERYRRKQLGKALVQCLEDIVESWGYSKLYLHVDIENKAALTLYQNEGYKDVGTRWNPYWAGRAAEIGYFVKKLDKKQDSRPKRVKKTKTKIIDE